MSTRTRTRLIRILAFASVVACAAAFADVARAGLPGDAVTTVSTATEPAVTTVTDSAAQVTDTTAAPEATTTVTQAAESTIEAAASAVETAAPAVSSTAPALVSPVTETLRARLTATSQTGDSVLGDVRGAVTSVTSPVAGATDLAAPTLTAADTYGSSVGSKTSVQTGAATTPPTPGPAAISPSTTATTGEVTQISQVGSRVPATQRTTPNEGSGFAFGPPVRVGSMMQDADSAAESPPGGPPRPPCRTVHRSSACSLPSEARAAAA
jgi:hypothetical protein